MAGSNVLIIIPARMAASRLPGKPLADIAGEAMIVHVLRRARAAAIGEVVVATDSEAIAASSREGRRLRHHDARRSCIRLRSDLRGARGRRSVPWLRHHRQCSGRPANAGACRRFARRCARSRDPAVDIAHAGGEIVHAPERSNPNVVKVVGSPIGPHRLRALLFHSRRGALGRGPLYHHIGLYAYRRELRSQRFVSLPPSALEMREKLEQLRALEAGMRIDVEIVDSVPLGVDTPEDLARARSLDRARPDEPWRRAKAAAGHQQSL